jgi:3-hydroxyisobutyrate dehydrogenase-like beta-hydroxyacid dehydrogenase
MTTIGFIGLGTMGGPMAMHLAKEHDVFAWNRTPRKFPHGSVVATPADAARARVIFTCVSDDEALRSVLFGTHGVFSGDLKGKVLVDCSTVSVALTEEISKRAHAASAAFADAPVTGSKVGAHQGTLLFMVGSDSTTLEEIRPLLTLMGERIVHCGPVTHGQRVKHVLNLVMALTLEGYLEGCALALKQGIALDAVREALDNSASRSEIAVRKMPAIVAGDFTAHFKTKLMRKDMLLAQEDWRSQKLTLPLAERIVGVFDKAMEHGDEDIAAIAKVLEMQGVRFRKS